MKRKWVFSFLWSKLFIYFFWPSLHQLVTHYTLIGGNQTQFLNAIASSFSTYKPLWQNGNRKTALRLETLYQTLYRLLRLSGFHSGKLTVNGKLWSAWPLMLPTISKTEVNQKWQLSKLIDLTWCPQSILWSFTCSQSLGHFWRGKSSFFGQNSWNFLDRHIFEV